MECGEIPASKFLYGPGKRVGIETSIRLLARADDDSPAALAKLDSFYLIQRMV
jgi:hypothetical protein